jgi:hypothetical protein
LGFDGCGLGLAGRRFAFGLFPQDGHQVLIHASARHFGRGRGGGGRVTGQIRDRIRCVGLAEKLFLLFEGEFYFRRQLEPCMAAGGTLDIATGIGDGRIVHLVFRIAVRTDQSHSLLSRLPRNGKTQPNCDTTRCHQPRTVTTGTHPALQPLSPWAMLRAQARGAVRDR